MTEAAPRERPDGERNSYGVRVIDGEQGWEVLIVDPGGEIAMRRVCGDEAEARTLASTIRQHAYWLSPERFRHYYRLGEPG